MSDERLLYWLVQDHGAAAVANAFGASSVELEIANPLVRTGMARVKAALSTLPPPVTT